MEKKRIEYLDAIKGFAIILVVMAHAIAWNYVDYTEICVYSPHQPMNVKMGGVIWQIIYSFHMPLFFMVSGYLSYKPYLWQDFLLYLRKKAIRLFLPWICCLWISYYIKNTAGYWFLLCLFEVSIIGFLWMILIERINHRNRLVTDLIGLGVMYAFFRIIHAGSWSIGTVSIGRFVDAFIPYSFGILLCKHKFLFNLCIEKSWFYTVCVILFASIFSSRYFLDFEICNIIYRHSQTLLAIIGSLIAFQAFSKNISAKLQPLLVYIGKKTMPIYILHFMFVMQINAVGEYILSMNPITSIVMQVSYSAIISTIAILLSLFVHRIITFSPLLKRIMFGE